MVVRHNLRGLLGIRRMDKALNAWIRQLCWVAKGVDKKIDEGVLQNGSVMWRGWRMTGLLRGSMYESVQVVAQLGRPRKRWMIPRRTA